MDTPMPSQKPSWEMDQRLMLHNVQAPRSVTTMARILVVLIVVTTVALIATPWQQNIAGSGRVIALSPEERVQTLEAAVEGRVLRWHVVEGASVKRGDPVVDLADNDPEILARLNQERDQLLRTVTESELRVTSLEARMGGLDETLTTSVAAAGLREAMARDRVAAAEQALEAARAASVTAGLNQERQGALLAKGLTSTRSVELADLEMATRRAEVERLVATLNAARAESASLGAELQRTRAESTARIDEARAALASSRSDVAKARAEIAKIDVRIARQETQQVVSPVDGTVLRVIARRSGELLKAGDPLAVIVPESTTDVVELWIDGNDMPMVLPGSPVRLQFEGWPALQFAGWPSVAVGTFGGRVTLIDRTDNGRGKFRALVEPDQTDEQWPSKRFLRLGVRANGWVLLNVVPIGYELWRQFNGFPPVIAPDEPSVAELTGVASKDLPTDASGPKDEDK
jgi:adhesin transport system membrane fusion protein